MKLDCSSNCPIACVDEESQKETQGTKAMRVKDRVILYACTNATRTNKVPLSMICRAKESRCFRNHAKKLDNYCQAKYQNFSKMVATISQLHQL